MTSKKIKCPGCGEKYEAKDWENSSYYGNIINDFICEGCEECEFERPSTLVKYNGQEKEIIRWGEYKAWDEYGDDPPEWFWKIFDGRKWHSTDAWRGYYETHFKNGFVKLADGWVTGWPDESVSRKVKAIELSELLDTGVILPAPLFWVFESTSNVFSTASEIFCDKKDRIKIVKWLKENGFDLEDLEQAFA